ncbi:Dehydroquinate synthase-like protein [Mytilinidion resinicola]|uniref:Dehydroquinate synthase-like protein n=1 Tax=Mytilinidion resinicola TaxID=574789 RepID=A0A6A6YCJ1_9PEZI|nr:Dehydroquinate synthase-like protein [Mytilinidion resinicola]KAF2806319.1 Dehydroquinate synthase-like protein [Mytilinidion resinicola]
MSLTLAKRRIQQLPIDWSTNHDAIFNSTILTDIPAALASWSSKRIILVYSKTLDAQTAHIKTLLTALGPLVAGTKSGVGAHSPYADVIAIARLLSATNADTLICIGSSSYSDACKNAASLHATLPAGFTAADMEALVDKDAGITAPMRNPTVKLILVPTSLSASEWNPISSATNPERKKQHFGTWTGGADLLLLDPEVASTAPQVLWLSSGVRAVDHCVETICNPDSNEAANGHAERGLRELLKGLREYKEGKEGADRGELLKGISECQVGAREAMIGLLVYRIPMGPSHAIGHQLGSVAGVMHGVTSCVMLAPVLRYTNGRNPKGQERVLRVFNDVLGWEEKEAADAVAKFVKLVGLPGSLKEVGVTEDSDVRLIADKTMTDAWGGKKRQLGTVEEVMAILNMAR